MTELLKENTFDTGRRHAATVDQQQRAIRAETAEVQRLRVRTVVEHEAVEARVDLGARSRFGALEDGGGIELADVIGRFGFENLQRRNAGVGIRALGACRIGLIVAGVPGKTSRLIPTPAGFQYAIATLSVRLRASGAGGRSVQVRVQCAVNFHPNAGCVPHPVVSPRS